MNLNFCHYLYLRKYFFRPILFDPISFYTYFNVLKRDNYKFILSCKIKKIKKILVTSTWSENIKMRKKNRKIIHEGSWWEGEGLIIKFGLHKYQGS